MGGTSDTEVTPDVGSYTSLEMIGGARIRGKYVIAFVGSHHAKIFSSFLNGGRRPVVTPCPKLPPLTLLDTRGVVTNFCWSGAAPETSLALQTLTK